MRILFLTHPGENSRDIFLDIIEGYAAAGHDVFLMELAPIWNIRDGKHSADAKRACIELYENTVYAFVHANRINLCITLWANAILSMGRQDNTSFFERAPVPVLMHWLDAPQWAHGGTILNIPGSLLNGPHSYHLVNNAGTASEMQAILGFSNVLWTRNAASPTTFQPHPEVDKEFDIVFGVGADHCQPTPGMLEELGKDAPDIGRIRREAAEAIKPELLEILAPLDGDPAIMTEFVEQLLVMRLACRDLEVLQQVSELARVHTRCAPAILSLLQDARRFVRFSMTLRRIEEWERAFTFVYLSQYFRCATFGLQDSFDGWPGDWTRLGKLPYQKQCIAYSRARFGLNVMRWQDDLGLNLKPFEITLSGACLLQSHRVGIEDCFNKDQCVVFHTPQECRDRVAEMLAHPTRIDEMAEAGHRRALDKHCWKHRAHEVLCLLTSGQQIADTTENSEIEASAGSPEIPIEV